MALVISTDHQSSTSPRRSWPFNDAFTCCKKERCWRSVKALRFVRWGSVKRRRWSLVLPPRPGRCCSVIVALVSSALVPCRWAQQVAMAEKPSDVKIYSFDEVALHNKVDDLWLIIEGKVGLSMHLRYQWTGLRFLILSIVIGRGITLPWHTTLLWL